MKKSLVVFLAALTTLALVACGSKDKDVAKNPDAMTYSEYVAAALDSEVCVETYVQANQSWWEKDGKGLITLYTQDKEGGYFIYEAACSKDLAAKLVPGTRILVKGVKSEWSGEVEIVDATISIVEGAKSYVAPATDATSKLGTDDIAKLQNQFVSFNGLTVVAKDGQGFFYKWDNSGSQGDDLYFDVTDGKNTYTFTVESYLCGKDTDVYKAVEAFKGGEKIDVEGFLYWYNGAQPHVTKVTKK